MGWNFDISTAVFLHVWQHDFILIVEVWFSNGGVIAFETGVVCICPSLIGKTKLLKDTEYLYGFCFPAHPVTGFCISKMAVVFMEHWLMNQNVAVLPTCLPPSPCLTSESKQLWNSIFGFKNHFGLGDGSFRLDRIHYIAVVLTVPLTDV